MFSWVISIIIHTVLISSMFLFKTKKDYQILDFNSIPVTFTRLSDITHHTHIGSVGVISDKHVQEDNKELVNSAKPPVLVAEPAAPVLDTVAEPAVEAKATVAELVKLDAKSARGKTVTPKLDAKTPPQKKAQKQNPPQAQTDTLGIDKLVQEALQAPSIDHKRQENIKNTSDQGANENPTHAGGQAIGATSASALVALVQTIRPCWSLLNTSKTNNINVRIKVNLDRQGYVINKTVLAPTNISSNDPHYKKVENSALQALSDKRCQPFKLPAKDFHIWKELVLNFSPSDMLMM